MDYEELKPYHMNDMSLDEAIAFLEHEKKEYTVQRGEVYNIIHTPKYKYYFGSDDDQYVKWEKR